MIILKIFSKKKHFIPVIFISIFFIINIGCTYENSANKTNENLNNSYNNYNNIDKIFKESSFLQIKDDLMLELIFYDFNTSVFEYNDKNINKKILINGEKAAKYVKNNSFYIYKGKIQYFKNNDKHQSIIGDFVKINDIGKIDTVEIYNNAKIKDIDNNFELFADKIVLDFKKNQFVASGNVKFRNGKEMYGSSDKITYNDTTKVIVLKQNAKIHYNMNYAYGDEIVIKNIKGFNTDSTKEEFNFEIKNGYFDYNEENQKIFSKGKFIEFNQDKIENRYLKVYSGEVEYESMNRANNEKIYFKSKGERLSYKIYNNKKYNNKDYYIKNKNNKNYDSKNTVNSDSNIEYTYYKAKNFIIKSLVNENRVIENIFFESINGKIIENTIINLTGKAIVMDYEKLSLIFAEKIKYNYANNVAYGENNLLIFQFDINNKEVVNSKNIIDLYLSLIKNNVKLTEQNVLNLMKKNKMQNVDSKVKEKLIDKIIFADKGNYNAKSKETKVNGNIIIFDFINLLTLRCLDLYYSGPKDDYYQLENNIQIKKYKNENSIIENKVPEQILEGGKAKIYNKKNYGIISIKPKLLDKEQNYFISADIIEAYLDKKIYLFKNNVLFVYSSLQDSKKTSTVAKTNYAVFNGNTEQLKLKGESFVSINGSESKAEDVLIDIKNKKIYLKKIVETKILDF